VGQVSGLYSLFAPVELRSRDADVCRSCTTKSCYSGNELGDPCPTFQFPAVMDQNTFCINCMECVKSCESDNLGINLRPWGEDVVALKKPRLDEAYLALILLALKGFHGLTMTESWGAIVDGIRLQYGWSESLAFSLGMAVIITGPILLYSCLVWLARRASGDATRAYRDHFIRYAYALLPIALFYHLAHNSEHLLMEGQRIVALASDPFGFEWDLFGTATWELGPLVSMTTLWGIQVLLVLVGHVYSLWVSHDVAGILHDSGRAARASQIPMLGAMIAFSVMSLWLLKQPMTMRMSWM
jgi:ferredoxin